MISMLCVVFLQKSTSVFLDEYMYCGSQAVTNFCWLSFHWARKHISCCCRVLHDFLLLIKSKDMFVCFILLRYYKVISLSSQMSNALPARIPSPSIRYPHYIAPFYDCCVSGVTIAPCTPSTGWGCCEVRSRFIVILAFQPRIKQVASHGLCLCVAPGGNHTSFSMQWFLNHGSYQQI